MAARGRRQWETTRDDNQDHANGRRRPGGPLRAFLKRRTSGIRRRAGRAYGRTRASGSTRTTEIAAKDPSTGRTSLRGGKREGRTEADGSNRQRAGMRITEDRFLTGRNLSPFTGFGTYRWTCGLVGADVVKNFGQRRKPGNIGYIGGVQHVCSPLYI